MLPPSLANVDATSTLNVPIRSGPKEALLEVSVFLFLIVVVHYLQ